MAGAAIGLVAGAKVTGLAAAAALAVGAVLLAPSATRVRGGDRSRRRRPPHGLDLVPAQPGRDGKPASVRAPAGLGPPELVVPRRAARARRSPTTPRTSASGPTTSSPASKTLFGSALVGGPGGAVAAGSSPERSAGAPARVLAASARGRLPRLHRHADDGRRARGGARASSHSRPGTPCPALLLGLLAGSWTLGRAPRGVARPPPRDCGPRRGRALGRRPRSPHSARSRRRRGSPPLRSSAGIAALPPVRRSSRGRSGGRGRSGAGRRPLPRGAYLRGDFDEATPLTRLGPTPGSS